MSTGAGSIDGLSSRLSGGLLHRSPESIGINEENTGYYNNASIITQALPVHGALSGTGTSLSPVTAGTTTTLQVARSEVQQGQALLLVKGGAAPNTTGQQGESATCSDKAGEKHCYVGPISNKLREADKITKTQLHETKNVAYQYLSTQLKDAIAYAQGTGRKFMLWVRESTKISAQLQKEIDNGTVRKKIIPGSK